MRSERWDVFPLSHTGNLVLKNRSRTLLRQNSRVSVDVPALLTQAEECGLPFAYSDQVREIYFTILPIRKNLAIHGRYIYTSNSIIVSCNSRNSEPMINTIVHEIGHHIDSVECISEYEGIRSEYSTGAQHLPDPGALKNVDEYVAFGFETFYLGTSVDRRKMRHLNPILWRMLSLIHRVYRSK